MIWRRRYRDGRWRAWLADHPGLGWGGVATLAVLLAVVLGGRVVQLGLGLVAEGTTYPRLVDHWLDRNMTWHHPLFWWAVSLVAGLAAAVWVVAWEDTFEPFAGLTALGLILVCLLAFGQMWGIHWNNKDHPRFYNASTTFVVPDVDDPPQTVQQLVVGATEVEDEDCTLVGAHDVPSCIREGDLPEEGWEDRGASLATALRVMTETTGESPRVELLADTAAYIHPGDEEDVAGRDEASEGMWTAIRDGSKYTPAEGVVQWDGRSRTAEVCTFEGDHELDRALRGQRSESLSHRLSEVFPGLRWRLDDAYGHCDGEEPVIVLPMFRQGRHGHRTVDVPAGVVLVRGSPSGDPRFEHIAVVEPGEVPGPVYPMAIAETQRKSASWAAGRRYKDHGEFGFDVTDAASQSTNDSEYLLRSRADGRTYWVTPVTPRESDSQRVRAFTVIPADEVTDGRLNEMIVYVLDDDDPRAVNLDSLENDISIYVSEQNQAYAADGRIQEITPSVGASWRTFGARDDQPFFVATYDPTADEPRPEVTYLRGASADDALPLDEGADAEPSPADAPCSQPLAELSDDELVACARAALDELDGRGG